MLRQRVAQMLARRRLERKHASRIGTPPAQERRARRLAQWILTERVIEDHAAPCECAEVRRLDRRVVAVAAERRAEIVRDDENHVPPRGGRGCDGAQRTEKLPAAGHGKALETL
jgi:hypothetical protein